MNNQTCIHNGITPKKITYCLHKLDINEEYNQCPICAYELGYLVGSSKNGFHLMNIMSFQIIK